MSSDSDHVIEAVLEQDGPFAAVENAAVLLLDDAREIDRLCLEFHPDNGQFWSEVEQSSFDHGQWHDWFAGLAIDLGDSVNRLKRMLSIGDTQQRLRAVNPYPASIENYHGESFAEAAYQLGADRYKRIYFAVDVQAAQQWWLQLSESPPLMTREAARKYAEFAVVALRIERMTNVDFARMHLLKERVRAEGRQIVSAAPAVKATERPGLNDDRDGWLYQERLRGESLKSLMVATQKNSNWESLNSEASVSAAITRYARKNGLNDPIIKRDGAKKR